MADGAHGDARDHRPQESPGEVAHSGGAPTLDMNVATGTVAFEAVAGDGSPAPTLDTTAAADMTTAAPISSLIGMSSPQPQMGAATASMVVDDDIVEEPKVVLGRPLLRAPRDIALDKAIGMACWALNQAQDMLHREH
jgi:hypothetical protein